MQTRFYQQSFRQLLALAVVYLSWLRVSGAESALVFQTDFGLKDGAVAAMKGVAHGVSPTLQQFDLTHEIPAYNIWEASLRLKQAVPYWPTGTVFVSVVDPGVGTVRKAIVAQTKSGHYIVTPDNGTLTFVAEELGLAEVREIDATRHRLPGSEASYTFHGRDLFAYTAARLAAGKITFAEVGPSLATNVVLLPYQHPTLTNGVLRGTVAILDPQYGNVWSNIPKTLLDELGAKHGEVFKVVIRHQDKTIYSGRMPYVASFGNVPEGKPLLYLNSLLEISVALNQADFAKQYEIASGPAWSIEIQRDKPKR